MRANSRIENRKGSGDIKNCLSWKEYNDYTMIYYMIYIRECFIFEMNTISMRELVDWWCTVICLHNFRWSLKWGIILLLLIYICVPSAYQLYTHPKCSWCQSCLEPQLMSLQRNFFTSMQFSLDFVIFRWALWEK